MADIAAVVIQTLQWVGAPVIRQIQYLCCFTRNITSLRNEANQLEDTTQDLQLQVDRAKNESRDIYRDVEAWLQQSNDIQIEKQGILDGVSNVESGCLKLGARFFLSRRAKKTTDRVKGLIILGQSKLHADVIAHPAPAAAAAAQKEIPTTKSAAEKEIPTTKSAAEKEIPTTKSYEYESRKQIEQDIMATLRGGDVNMIGICGMGGLGKTTMAKKIRNRALKEHVFDKVVMVVVSRPIDQLKIQLEIGGSLGLKLEGECSEARVQKLHARLSRTEATEATEKEATEATEKEAREKRILLVLDDVWEELVLEDLGIPSSNKGCTILFTSRNHDVLSAMNVQIFGMKVLSEEDSWIMFRDRVGTCVDNTELNSLARKVVNECKGLPLALTVVGAALKDQVDVNAWKNAVGRLEKGDPDIPKFIAKVYTPLKLSYDDLEPKYQDVFLLCCVYPEDADIPLEQLTYFCMGLRIATGNVEAARNRIRALTKVLKNRSLLLDSEKGDEYVRMHDVVRDVCVFIAKHEGYIGDNDLTSSLQRYKLHSGFELLQIRNSDEEINFHGITNLYVLSIERCSQLTSLPFTERPNNLITLVLDSCGRLETLSVGELVNLEILLCRRCYSVKELPPEICDDRISSNSFQNLKILKLDDLPVLKQLWKSSQNDLGKDFLPQLEVLSIWDCKMMEAVFLWKGEDGNENTSCHHTTKRFPKLKELLLYKLPNLISLCQGIEGIEFPLMRKIEIRRCGKMKGMVWNEKISGGSSNNASIHALFCPQQVSFSELEELIIIRCQGILSLFTSSMAGNLLNLKELCIQDCFEMVEVIKDDEEKGMSGGRQRPLLFPKLHTLKLRSLPKLVRFCESKGIESIQFPVLRSMEINGCRKMKGNSGGDSTNAADIIHLFCQSKQVSFGCLKELNYDRNPFCSHTIHGSVFDRLEVLEIRKCKGSMSLFSSSITGNLGNLITLIIIDCYYMEKVVSGAQRTTIFPKLHKIVLVGLPSLVSFCEWKCDVELPSLTRVEIDYCHQMKSCTAGLLTTPNLKSVTIDCEVFGDVKDLNELVKQQYLRGAEKCREEAVYVGDDDDDDDDGFEWVGAETVPVASIGRKRRGTGRGDDDDDDVKDLNGLVQQQCLRRAVAMPMCEVGDYDYDYDDHWRSQRGARGW